MDVGAFEKIALPALDPMEESEPTAVYLLDGIGEMECLSKR